jgi:serine/threonine-protein kinase
VDGAELVAFSDPRIGTTLAGRYQIESGIGIGGMATVYRARHRLVDRPCAIKVMSSAFAKNEVVRERFRREARACQRLAHPNIIEIFDQGETDDGSLYLVMELLEGEVLVDVLERGPMPLERALPILIQIARALARAHDLEVIHRDLKPENIFLAREESGAERVVLLDFGIARSQDDTRLTGAGEVFGTPQYMAPERITSIDAGPAADLYAVGMIAFEMLTGQLPYGASSIAEWFMAHVQSQPARLRSLDASLPEALDKLIAELLAKDPAERPVDAHSLHAVLVLLCGEIGIRVPLESTGAARGRSLSLPPANLDVWERRVALFGRMLRDGYATPPAELTALLSELQANVSRVLALRTQCFEETKLLEAVEVRAREGRQRFGHAVDALGIDASKARNEAKDAVHALSEQEKRLEAYAARFMKLHEHAVHWEGRSGMMEPHAQLAKAYHALGSCVEEWGQEQARLRELQERAHTKRGEVTDLEFQIQTLRNALANFEQSIEAERSTRHQRVSELGRSADSLEGSLALVAGRLLAPMRRKPELAPFFRELETGAAA